MMETIHSRGNAFNSVPSFKTWDVLCDIQKNKPAHLIKKHRRGFDRYHSRLKRIQHGFFPVLSFLMSKIPSHIPSHYAPLLV